MNYLIIIWIISAISTTIYGLYCDWNLVKSGTYCIRYFGISAKNTNYGVNREANN
jgi:hypothetical protein